MTSYIGRFAPSPTGPLHIGSLFAALASYLDARHHQGQWLLRIEDLDPPREQTGATDAIINSLKHHGLAWDGEIVFQGQRQHAYQQALEMLDSHGECFACTCSRQQLAGLGDAYPGTCRDAHIDTAQDHAIRLKAPEPAPTFHDRLLGYQQAQPVEPGYSRDFIIKRKDGLFAYQLAVVVDDIDAGITDIVRGSDILDSTFKQLYLYQALGHNPPTYLHIPVINNPQGQKLSKQNHALPIDNTQAKDNLLYCLGLMRQPLPEDVTNISIDKLLEWAALHWSIEKIPNTMAINS